MDANGWAAFAAVAAKLGEGEEAVQAYYECAAQHSNMGHTEASAMAWFEAASLMMGEPFRSNIQEAMAEPQGGVYPGDPRLEMLNMAMNMKGIPDMPELLLLSALVESSYDRYEKAVQLATAAIEMGCVQGNIAGAGRLQTIVTAAAPRKCDVKEIPVAKLSHSLCSGDMESQCQCTVLGRENATYTSITTTSSSSSFACLAGRTGRVDVPSYFEGPYLVLKEAYEQMGNAAAAREASDNYQLALKAREQFLMEPVMGLWHKHHKEVSLSLS